MLPGLMMALPGLASAAGGLMGLFGKQKNPSDAANKYLDQIPGAAGQYYNPYIQSGQNALGTLQGEYGKLLGDPNSMYDKFGAGYKESPGYQFKLKQGLQAGQNASAAGGMLGTPQDQQQQMQIANDISSQDFNDYISQIAGLYGQGLQGTQGLNQQGYDASSSMGNLQGSVLGQKAQNAFTGQQGQNQANQQNWSNIFGGLGAAGQGYNQQQQLQQLMQLLGGGQ
jgi:hypothetical protein